ncbi:MAG: YggU family protein [Clostridiales bacterium]|nr:YggU family protein [Clostridiales bacterium]
MPFKDALREVSDGIVIDLEVTPGSKHTCIPSGYNPWRKRIEVKLSKAAQKGKANEQLIEHLAVLFDISSSSISIINGAKSSQKSILIKTVNIDLAVSVLGKNTED